MAKTVKDFGLGRVVKGKNIIYHCIFVALYSLILDREINRNNLKFEFLVNYAPVRTSKNTIFVLT